MPVTATPPGISPLAVPSPPAVGMTGAAELAFIALASVWPKPSLGICSRTTS